MIIVVADAVDLLSVETDQIIAGRIDSDDVGPFFNLGSDLVIVDLDMDLAVTIQPRHKTVAAGHIDDVVPGFRFQIIQGILGIDVDRMIFAKHRQDILTGSDIADIEIVLDGTGTDKGAGRRDHTVIVHDDRAVGRREDLFDVSHIIQVTGAL